MNERILIADDNPDLLALLQRRLELEGYRVDSVTTGKDALLLHEDATTASDPYKVMIFDVAMPMTIGIDVVLEIRARGDIGTPAIIYTALPATEIERPARLHGANAIRYKGKHDTTIIRDVSAALAGTLEWHAPYKLE